MNAVFVIVNLVFLVTALAIVGIQHKDLSSARKNIFNYSVIPSLFFAASALSGRCTVTAVPFFGSDSTQM